MSVQDRLAGYIQSELIPDAQAGPPGPDDPLVGSGGVLDSVGLHQLAMFVEKEFGFEIEPLDYVPENFGTLSALTAYIESKQSS